MGQTGYTLSNDLGNPELEPEKTTSWEIGADLKFFNNRLGIDFTYFNNYSDGLLMPVGLSGASGYYWVEMNSAGMSSKGIEAVIIWKSPAKGKLELGSLFKLYKNQKYC